MIEFKSSPYFSLQCSLPSLSMQHLFNLPLSFCTYCHMMSRISLQIKSTCNTFLPCWLLFSVVPNHPLHLKNVQVTACLLHWEPFALLRRRHRLLPKKGSSQQMTLYRCSEIDCMQIHGADKVQQCCSSKIPWKIDRTMYKIVYNIELHYKV